MSSDEEEEDESDVRKVMPGEANAALLAAQNAAANALQAAVRNPIWPLHIFTMHLWGHHPW